MIYLDNASTTRVRNEVIKVITDELNIYGNPSSPHKIGYKAWTDLNQARKIIAKTIDAEPDEIYFTSGATEGNNWIIKGCCDNIITSTIEHHSILNAAKHKNTKYIPVIYDGLVNFRCYKDALQNFAFNGDKFLTSIMFTNNEIGTKQPIKYLSDLTHEYGGLFHTDATQAYGHENINVKNLGIDMMTMSGHKIGAPKGIGFVYIKRGIEINNLIDGGQQERGKRAGTENVPYIVGLAKACELVNKNKITYEIAYNNFYYDVINKLKDFKNVRINGGNPSNIVSITFNDIRAEELVEYLNSHDIQISSGSACNSESSDPSHVLLAIGLSEDEANSTIRVSFGPDNTKNDIDVLFENIKNYISLRGM